MCSVELISDDLCIKDGSEVLEILEHVLVFPGTGDLADEQSDVNHSSFEATLVEQCLLLECIVCIFKLANRFLIIEIVIHRSLRRHLIHVETLHSHKRVLLSDQETRAERVLGQVQGSEGVQLVDRLRDDWL